MASSDRFLLLDPKNCLPSKFITSLLGRVCDNPNQPSANYFPEDPSPFYSSSAAPFHVEARSTSLIVGHRANAVARVLIDELLSVERDKAQAPTANWFGESARVFTLPQERQVLRNLLQDPQLRAQAEDWLDDSESLYMITGFITVVNASCQVGDSKSSAIGFQASISKALEAAILALGGVPVELPSLGAEWRNQSDKSVEWSATYAGESIVAIRYRQLGRKGMILSKLLKGDITMRKNLDIPGAGARMFGHEDEANTEEIKEWEAHMSNGLDDDEKEEVALSPSSDAELQARDGNVIISLGSA